LFQKIYPLLLVFFIGIIFAQDAPPSDTEDQKDIEASEDQNAVPEDQGVVPEDQGSVPEDQNVASEETVPMKSDEKPTKEKKSKPPKIQKPKTQMGSLLRGIVVPGLGQVYNGNQRIGYLWMGIEATLLAATMNFKSTYDTSLDDYNNYQTLYWEETDVDLLLLYKEKRDASRKDMDAANSSYTIFSGLLAAGWLYSAVSAYLEGPGTSRYSQRNRRDQSNMDMNVAFNHEQQKMQLEFSIPLR
tara:strand:+ start:2616 stop:3347 length:732 start_codon:yes stop_codon:yes gene_type:complete